MNVVVARVPVDYPPVYSTPAPTSTILPPGPQATLRAGRRHEEQGQKSDGTLLRCRV